MSKKKLLLAGAVGAALIYGAVHQGVIEGPAKMFSYTKFAAASDQLGCKAIATSMLFEDVPLGDDDKPAGKVKVLAQPGTDQLSLKIDEGARTLKVQTGAGLQIGRVDPEVMAIMHSDPNKLVAVQITSSDAAVFSSAGRTTWNAADGEQLCAPGH